MPMPASSRWILRAALGIEGVVTVLTPEDIPGKNDTGAIRNDEPLLPTDEVSYWGQPIVWVVGETETAARLGAEQVKIEYEPLPAILSIPEAIEAQSFHSAPDLCTRGNALRAFESADHVLEGEVDMNGQDHFYLETQAAWTIPDTEGNFQVYSSTQHPSSTQQHGGGCVGPAQQPGGGDLSAHGGRLWRERIPGQSGGLRSRPWPPSKLANPPASASAATRT